VLFDKRNTRYVTCIILIIGDNNHVRTQNMIFFNDIIERSQLGVPICNCNYYFTKQYETGLIHLGLWDYRVPSALLYFLVDNNNFRTHT